MLKCSLFSHYFYGKIKYDDDDDDDYDDDDDDVVAYVL